MSNGQGTHPTDGEVAPEPCAHGGGSANARFTFERATKGQCIEGFKYPVAEMGTEHVYFAQCAMELLKHVGGEVQAQEALMRLMRPLLERQDDAPTSVLQLLTVEHGQLRPLINPDLSMRDPPMRDGAYVPGALFETFKSPDTRDPSKTKNCVQAPGALGGEYYEVLALRSTHFSTRLVFEFIGSSFNLDQHGDEPDEALTYLISMKCSSRSNAQGAASLGRKLCIKLKIGHQSSSHGGVVHWGGDAGDEMCIDNLPLMYKLFFSSHTKFKCWPKWEPQQEEEEDHETDGEGGGGPQVILGGVLGVGGTVCTDSMHPHHAISSAVMLFSSNISPPPMEKGGSDLRGGVCCAPPACGEGRQDVH